jgi:hypothetical protein
MLMHPWSPFTNPRYNAGRLRGPFTLQVMLEVIRAWSHVVARCPLKILHMRHLRLCRDVSDLSQGKLYLSHMHTKAALASTIQAWRIHR